MDPKNLVVLTGGVVRDPEVINDNILKFSIAVNYAGSEKGSENNSGYFDVTYFLNGGDERISKFVRGQLDAGNLKQGAQLSIMGRLNHERWTSDDGKRSKVAVIAEVISYAGGSKPAESSGSSSSTSDAGAAANIAEF